MGSCKSIKTEADVPAVMRDGVTLYTDICWPDAKGQFPASLHRTPCNKALPAPATGRRDCKVGQL